MIAVTLACSLVAGMVNKDPVHATLVQVIVANLLLATSTHVQLCTHIQKLARLIQGIILHTMLIPAQTIGPFKLVRGCRLLYSS